MKLANLIWGAAACLAFAACSSDEPAPKKTTTGDGQTAYIAVNISDVNGGKHFNAPKRATTPDDFAFGDEHAIVNARFFFFDENGVFVTEANVWTGGQDVTPADKNVEFQGNNVLVLKGIRDKSALAYMVTVLNAPTTLAPVENMTTLDEFSKVTFDAVSRKATIDGKDTDVFYMSTSSFVSEDTKHYDKKYYYANKLDASDYITVPESAGEITSEQLKDLNVVKVYVERLAAKVTLNMPAGPIELTMTVAGTPANPNVNEEDAFGVASTKLYIQFDNWSVSCTAPLTYLSKQLNANTPGYFTDWNEPTRFRSYWAEAYQYGQKQDLVYKTFAQINNGAGVAVTAPAYEKETTNTVDQITTDGGKTLVRNNVACAMITATVYADAACTTPANLVYYKGIYYTKDHYIKYALSALNASKDLNFYTKEGDEFTQISAGDVDFVSADDNASGHILMVYNGTETLYSLKAGTTGEDEGDWAVVTADALNTVLAAFNNNGEATAYTDGKMYYAVPIEHLVAGAVTGDVNLGQYGLVRNHWYQLSVNKVLNLGKGIFDPDKQQLTPGNEDDNEKFGLAADIEILSWRIVKQDVSL